MTLLMSPLSSGLAEELILAHSAAMVIWPVAFLLPYYFRATGKAAFTMKVAVFAMAVFRVGLAYLFIDSASGTKTYCGYGMPCSSTGSSALLYSGIIS